jgi:hypothetical protein
MINIGSMLPAISCQDRANLINKARLVRLSAMIAILIAGTFLASPATVEAATKTSTGTGGWNTAGTWSPGGVPANGDDGIIAATHVVTVDTNTNSLASLTVSGTLTVGNNNTDRTVTVTGLVQVNSGGTLNTAGNGGNDLIIGGT